MNDFINDFLKYIERLPEWGEDSSRILTISSTAKKFSGSYYFTPIRITNNLNVCGVVFKDSEHISILSKYFKLFDFIFVDQEKKIFDCFGNALNIEKDAIESAPSGTKLIAFKPNDLTVDASFNEISSHFSSLGMTMGGSKSLIVGAGNVGSKLALRLVEVGVEVYLFRRSLAKGQAIVNAINIIKPDATLATAHLVGDLKHVHGHKFHSMIGASDSPVADVPSQCLIEKNSLVLDIGKGSFSMPFLDKARQKDCVVLRCSIENALINLIAQLFSSSKKRPKRHKKSGKFYVSGGYLGALGDIVVDDAENPQFEYGISNGWGDFVGR